IGGHDHIDRTNPAIPAVRRAGGELRRTIDADDDGGIAPDRYRGARYKPRTGDNHLLASVGMTLIGVDIVEGRWRHISETIGEAAGAFSRRYGYIDRAAAARRDGRGDLRRRNIGEGGGRVGAELNLHHAGKVSA